MCYRVDYRRGNRACHSLRRSFVLGCVTVSDDLRPLLFSIAYRMLGSVGDAEDLVQEAFLRLERAHQQGTDIESTKAFLTTVTTRLAIDQLRSARAKRETYFGPWLPEPLVSTDEPDPAEVAEMSDSLSLSFLVLLETLSPVERAVFLLREVFDYGYDEISEIVQKSEPNCRQIFTRARKRIDEGKPRFEADRAERANVAERFVEAFRDGSVESLVSLLAGDAVFFGDGGGKGRGLPRPIYGAAKIARLLAAFRLEGERIGGRTEPAWVGDQPGVINLDADGALINVMAFEIADGQVQGIRSIINPDKLTHLGYRLSPHATARAVTDPDPSSS
jgi:RNA polymerase sigma-70 factor (TIGR02957 family)